MKKVWLAVGLSAALGLGAMAAAALGFHGFPGEGPGERDGRIGLMSSLPLYRAPESSVAEALAAQSVRHHWVRAVLEKRGTLEPLDVLDPDSLANRQPYGIFRRPCRAVLRQWYLIVHRRDDGVGRD